VWSSEYICYYRDMEERKMVDKTEMVDTTSLSAEDLADIDAARQARKEESVDWEDAKRSLAK